MSKDYRVASPMDPNELNEWIRRRLAGIQYSYGGGDHYVVPEYNENPWVATCFNLSLLREKFLDRNIVLRNNVEEMVQWIQELIWYVETSSHQVIRLRNLENLNYNQASKIMNMEQELRMVKKEATESIDNVLDFAECRRALQTGGLPPNGDWLTEMKLGTEFLVRPKTQKTWVLAKFMQAGVRNDNVLLIPMQGEAVTAPDNEWIWADPVEFCKFWELKGILLEPIDE